MKKLLEFFRSLKEHEQIILVSILALPAFILFSGISIMLVQALARIGNAGLNYFGV